jgi:pilus assembly protein CpaC
VTDNVGATRFAGILRALESDGLSRTLAEPNLTALTGEAAAFHAGGQIPYSVCNVTNGAQQCEVKFKDYGVNLSFTPTVIDEGRINIKLETSVSDLSSLRVNGIPGLDARSTTTTLELPSGGSMMIAGLISETTRQNINGLPGLKKLPVLGNLFRSREFQSSETELVVIVSPFLVNSAAGNKLTTPDKNFNPATERQSLFFGKLHKTYGASGKAPKGQYNGNVGFIVE